MPGECGIVEYQIDLATDGSKQPKRDKDGKLMHILDDNGKPVKKTGENGEKLEAAYAVYVVDKKDTRLAGKAVQLIDE